MHYLLGTFSEDPQITSKKRDNGPKNSQTHRHQQAQTSPSQTSNQIEEPARKPDRGAKCKPVRGALLYGNSFSGNPA